MRLFVAVTPPPELTEKLRLTQRALAEAAGRDTVRWVAAGQWHLTLKFLGETEEDRGAELCSQLASACGGFSGFKLELAGAGCFPNCRRPRVIWVGVSGETARLAALQGEIERALDPDHPEPREFVPHLTLGRVSVTNRAVLQQLGQAVESAAIGHLGEWPVREVELIESRLGSAHARYQTLATVPL